MPATALLKLSDAELEALDTRISRKLTEVGKLRWRRDFTEAERRVDFVKLAEQFDSAEAQIASTVAPVLAKQRARLMAQAKAAVNEARRNKGVTLAADTAAFKAGYHGAYQSALLSTLAGLYRFGKQSVMAELGAAKQAADDNRALPGRIKQLAERLAHEAADRMGQKAAGIVFNALIGLVDGEDEYWDELDDESLFAQLSGGLEEFTPRIAKDHAGISAGLAINAGRIDAAEGFEVETAQWSAILDTRTCELCQWLDGRRILIDDPDFQIYRPGGLHPNDRCIWIFLTTDDPESENIDWEAPPIELVLAHAPYLEWAVHYDPADEEAA